MTKLIYVDTLTSDKKASAINLLFEMRDTRGWKVKAAEGWTMEDIVSVTVPEKDIEALLLVSRVIDFAALEG